MNIVFVFCLFITLLDTPLNENKENKKNETPAQDKLTDRLNALDESIASLVDLEKKIGLISESKTHLKSLVVERSHWKEVETA